MRRHHRCLDGLRQHLAARPYACGRGAVDRELGVCAGDADERPPAGGVGMLEDVSEMQFKELPALVDSIKNQVGIDQATQFNADATAALAGLVQNLQGAKQQLDAALNVVTGQAPAGAAAAGAMGADIAAGAADMAAAGADMAAAGDMGAEAGMDAAMDPAAAEAGAEPPAAVLGRAKR